MEDKDSARIYIQSILVVSKKVLVIMITMLIELLIFPYIFRIHKDIIVLKLKSTNIQSNHLLLYPIIHLSILVEVEIDNQLCEFFV